MIETLVGLGFTAAWIAEEITLRRRHGLEPSTLRAAVNLARKKGAPDPRVPAAIFPIAVFFCCAVWESTMRFLLGFERVAGWGVMGAAFAVAFGWRRARRLALKTAPLDRSETFQLLIVWVLLFGAAWSFLLTPWIWFRTRHLPWSSRSR